MLFYTKATATKWIVQCSHEKHQLIIKKCHKWMECLQIHRQLSEKIVELFSRRQYVKYSYKSN